MSALRWAVVFNPFVHFNVAVNMSDKGTGILFAQCQMLFLCAISSYQTEKVSDSKWELKQLDFYIAAGQKQWRKQTH